MTGFFMYDSGTRLEAYYHDEEDFTGVTLSILQDDQESTITFTDPDELGELIAYLSECRDKLNFKQQ